jgi:hypothetical protein
MHFWSCIDKYIEFIKGKIHSHGEGFEPRSFFFADDDLENKGYALNSTFDFRLILKWLAP